ncbi:MULTISPECIES: phage head-tail connector protein [Cytobacillus]|uniref:phage head-tail connector protein n=1 Tax=Cytobacillus TaxID=2675230 RepID=UPI002040A6A7|nr:MULTISPECIES: phage head-tail connector protein [Cytobacillus]MCM3394865.1 phage head-tail connector protein [Cytobacillus oceanisediminis]UQX56055.1 phage head-tail connector protein [Cytobacillus pseudoceanisediminis]
MTLSVGEKVKVLLNIEDDLNNTVLEILEENATYFILNRLKVEIVPETLNSTLVKMVIHDFQKRKNSKNGLLKSKQEGDMQESYLTDYPKEIIDEIDSKRKIRVI